MSHPHPAKRNKPKNTSHAFYVLGLPRIAYAVCDKCGLVKLRNAATDKRVRAACPGRDED